MHLNWKRVVTATLALGLLSASTVMAQEPASKPVPVNEVVLISKSKNPSAAPNTSNLVAFGIVIRIAAH
jgi:hypothetical protein